MDRANILKIFTNLGPKYSVPRDVQVNILEHLWENPTKLTMIEAPTGIGKSAIAVALSEMLHIPLSVITTATISLQDQYDGDFPSVMKLVGRSNFRCERGNYSAAEAPCVIDSSISCASDYHRQEEEFWEAEKIVTNYALYLSELMRGRRFYERRPSLLICDEGHRLLDFLSSAETVKLDTGLARRLRLDCPEIESLAGAKNWADENVDRIAARAYVASTSGYRNAADWVALMHQARAIVDAPDDLIVVRTGRVLEATPLWPTRSAELLLNSSDTIVVMSATLWGGEFFAELLGYKGHYEYVTAPSPFDSSRWPVYYRPVVSLNQRSTQEDWFEMGDTCHRYIHDNPNDKGIIHVASRNQVDLLSRRISSCRTCRGRLVLLQRGGQRSEDISRYRQHPTAWIIHPSIGEGESFDDEQCRIQLIAKLRYPDLSDPLVKLRSEDKGLGSRFYFNSTAAYTSQTIGRGMRHAEDYCQTYILDGSFGRLYDRDRRAFPLWFQNQLR